MANEIEREALALRFRSKFSSEGIGAGGERQGNVQPLFVGAFDTVASLRSSMAAVIVLAVLACLIAIGVWIGDTGPWWLKVIGVIVSGWLLWRLVRDYLPLRFFVPNNVFPLPVWHPRRWWGGLRHAHVAWWSGRNYDRYVDKEVGYLRHAQSIDEDRRKFPRVGWGSRADVKWNEDRGHSDWLKQWWFAGNHSDVGGSYPEDESRLSDIALQWMIDELKEALGDHVQIVEERLYTSPDATALQHCERKALLYGQPRWLRTLTRDKLTWLKCSRAIDPGAPLHPSVYERLSAPAVPQMDAVLPYRPEPLRDHELASRHFE